MLLILIQKKIVRIRIRINSVGSLQQTIDNLNCGQVEEEVLFELFQNAGPLQRVTIPRDRETKKAKAYAFIGTAISHYSYHTPAN